MTRRLLILTFIECTATIIIERGMYFFGTEWLNFSDRANLWLALLFGAFYVAGALSSAPLTKRISPRFQIRISIALQLLVTILFAIRPEPWMFYVTTSALGILNGIKWPVVASFLIAGKTPHEASRTLGTYNLCWGTSVLFALIVTGPLIALHPIAMFIPPILCHFVTIYLTRGLPAKPEHLPDDHPERPPPAQLAHGKELMTASRWLLFSNYALMWILAALFPRLLFDIGLPVDLASGVSAIGDGCRVLVFLFMARSIAWHYKAWPQVISILSLPAGFWLVLESGSLAGIMLGQVLLGITAGLTFMSALYYAMVLKNAAVDAGGQHEGMIGLAFAIGPAVVLLSERVTESRDGILIGAFILITLCTLAPLYLLTRHRRMARAYEPVETL